MCDAERVLDVVARIVVELLLGDGEDRRERGGLFDACAE